MENQQTNETKQQLLGKEASTPATFGKKLVGETNDPYYNLTIDRIKKLSAELADIAQEHRINGKSEISSIHNQLYAHTIAEILNAHTNVVKLVTLRYHLNF